MDTRTKSTGVMEFWKAGSATQTPDMSAQKIAIRTLQNLWAYRQSLTACRSSHCIKPSIPSDPVRRRLSEGLPGRPPLSDTLHSQP